MFDVEDFFDDIPNDTATDEIKYTPICEDLTDDEDNIPDIPSTSQNDQNNQTDVIHENSTVISITLNKTVRTYGNGDVETAYDHSFSSSQNIDPRDFDWRFFL